MSSKCVKFSTYLKKKKSENLYIDSGSTNIDTAGNIIEIPINSKKITKKFNKEIKKKVNFSLLSNIL